MRLVVSDAHQGLKNAIVVGSFPNDAAPIRIAGALLIEQSDDWLVARRYLCEASMAKVLAFGQEHIDQENRAEASELRSPPEPPASAHRRTTSMVQR